jgi:lysophospholipase L1-like esterase
MKFQMKAFQVGCLAVCVMVMSPSVAFSEGGFLVKGGGAIVFLGDSITQAGTGPDGYITLFKQACDVTGHKLNVINAGISGHKSNDMLARLQRDVIDRKPDWVSISCGVNDVWHGERGVPLPDYKKNMAEIIDRCQQAGIKVLLLTATPIYENPDSKENQKLAAYNEYLRELAKDKKVLLCDLSKAFLSVYRNKTVKQNILTTDGVHMNPRGNGLMAREIFRSLGATEEELKKADDAWGPGRRPPVPAESPLKLSKICWDFETGDLQEWTQSGNLTRQPTSRSNDRHSGNFNKQGKYFIGTAELETPGTAYNDDLTGELKSPTFLIDAPAMSLLVGGGSGENLRVALYDANTGKELMLARGRNAEAMRRVIWDLGELQGRAVYLKIVDAAKGGWGHINVDDIHPLTTEEIEAMERAQREKKEAAQKKIANLLENVFKAERKVYSGDELHPLGMPLGPVGGGSIYLRGTGELYRWEIFNNMNSAAHIPDQFFAIRAKPADGEAVTRLLRYDNGKAPGVKDIRFVGEFPIAYLDYIDPALPVKVSGTFFSPFIPTNAKDSALPMIFFGFTVANESSKNVTVSLMGTLQNAVGYDGKARYEGVAWEGYGANANMLLPGGHNEVFVFMTKEGASGSMGLAMAGEGATANAQWEDAKSFLEEFSRTGSLGVAADGPSEKGKTYNAALASSFEVAPGESKEVGFVLLWYFPGRLGVGNMYENWFGSAIDLAMYLNHARRLSRATTLFHDTLFDTTLPYYAVERLSSQMSTPCTQLCMWLKDNSFFGWEGLHSDGTGCCPMNCNHVWNYEQTLARLFPEIEKRMRVIDLEHQMQDNGAVHHRVAFPLQAK